MSRDPTAAEVRESPVWPFVKKKTAEAQVRRLALNETLKTMGQEEMQQPSAADQAHQQRPAAKEAGYGTFNAERARLTLIRAVEPRVLQPPHERVELRNYFSTMALAAESAHSGDVRCARPCLSGALDASTRRSQTQPAAAVPRPHPPLTRPFHGPPWSKTPRPTCPRYCCPPPDQSLTRPHAPSSSHSPSTHPSRRLPVGQQDGFSSTTDDELEQAALLFAHFDMDSDGLLSRAEFFGLLGLVAAKAGHTYSEEHLTAMFAEADINRDGALDLNELLILLRAPKTAPMAQVELLRAPQPQPRAPAALLERSLQDDAKRTDSRGGSSRSTSLSHPTRGHRKKRSG